MPRRPYLILFYVFALLVLNGCSAIPSTPEPASTMTTSLGMAGDTVVSLTFDDGDADNFSASPILKEYGLHATFYIPSGLVGTDGYMSWDQLQTLQGDGNEIGGHTLSHQKVEGLDAETLKHQICDDRTALMDRGFKVTSFAYPFGNYDEPAKRMVEECGYSSARTVRGGPELIHPSDPYALLAFPYIVNDTGIAKLTRYVSQVRKDGGGWVIIVFHKTILANLMVLTINALHVAVTEKQIADAARSGQYRFLTAMGENRIDGKTDARLTVAES